MTEMTPGQAAYEAYVARMTAATSDITGSVPFQPWGQLPPAIQAAMDASAEAVAAPLRADLADAEALVKRWPLCPDGCGCRLGDTLDGAGDADRADCGCDGPCTMECRENGYPDAMSYRDLAVKHAMDERDDYRTRLEGALLAEAQARVDLDGAREQLAKALAANERWAETLGNVQQRHTEVKRQRDDARKAFFTLRSTFGKGKQSGWTARISGTVLHRLCVQAMCEPPDGSGQPDEASSLREQLAILKSALQRIALGHKITSQAQASVIADQALVDATAKRAGLEQP